MAKTMYFRVEGWTDLIEVGGFRSCGVANPGIGFGLGGGGGVLSINQAKQLCAFLERLIPEAERLEQKEIDRIRGSSVTP